MKLLWNYVDNLLVNYWNPKTNTTDSAVYSENMKHSQNLNKKLKILKIEKWKYMNTNMLCLTHGLLAWVHNSNVAIAALVLKYQAISIHSADEVFII